MHARSLWTAALVATLPSTLVGQSAVTPRALFITVENNVELEVLDWGGSGRPVVLLAGNGNTAHDFNDFASSLKASYHVYGITRRRFGASSAPPTGYEADRLADDVLAVIDSLGLRRPVLVGHSLAGQELSSIGSRHPEKVSGLIYLDAAYQFAFYNGSPSNLRIDLNELRRRIAQLQAATDPGEMRQLIEQLLDTDLPAFERDLRETQKQLSPSSMDPPPPVLPSRNGVARAIAEGMQRYTDIRAPVLAIFAIWPDTSPDELAMQFFQADAFERGVPTARVVRLRNADHFVFRSNEADVLREMHAFIGRLPPWR
ncbi:MAG: alpha/beta fold hydrolase [Longimicrobiales bacterium]